MDFRTLVLDTQSKLISFRPHASGSHQCTYKGKGYTYSFFVSCGEFLIKKCWLNVELDIIYVSFVDNPSFFKEEKK